MSHFDRSSATAYNSLCDGHLAGYFSNTKMRRHLRKAGLVSRRGEIISENTYRLNMARKDHKKYVKDLLAQAIVHKTLDLERNRQSQIKRKLEEIAKIEQVRKVRASENNSDKDLLPLLKPNCKSPRSRSGPNDGPGYCHPKYRASSVPCDQSESNMSFESSQNEEVIYVDDDGNPISCQGQDPPFGRRSRSSPRQDRDSQHVYVLDPKALRQYAMNLARYEQGYGHPSPYLMPQVPIPPVSPRVGHSARSRRGRSRSDSAEKSPRRPVSANGYIRLHRPEPPMQHTDRSPSKCKVKMKYHGWALHLSRDEVDPKQEVVIEQQHCGGNTLTVFKNKLLPGSSFEFTSERHRGYPFSLTIFLDGRQDCRVSTCCEYRHRTGVRLGGKQGHFSIVSVDRAAPCYKCQVERGGSRRKPKKEDKDRKPAEMREEVTIVSEDFPKQERGIMKATEEEEDTVVLVPVENDGDETQPEKDEKTVEKNETKTSEQGDYDDDFEDSDSDSESEDSNKEDNEEPPKQTEKTASKNQREQTSKKEIYSVGDGEEEKPTAKKEVEIEQEAPTHKTDNNSLDVDGNRKVEGYSSEEEDLDGATSSKVPIEKRPDDKKLPARAQSSRNRENMRRTSYHSSSSSSPSASPRSSPAPPEKTKIVPLKEDKSGSTTVTPIALVPEISVVTPSKRTDEPDSREKEYERMKMKMETKTSKDKCKEANVDADFESSISSRSSISPITTSSYSSRTPKTESRSSTQRSLDNEVQRAEMGETDQSPPSSVPERPVSPVAMALMAEEAGSAEDKDGGTEHPESSRDEDDRRDGGGDDQDTRLKESVSDRTGSYLFQDKDSVKDQGREKKDELPASGKERITESGGNVMKEKEEAKPDRKSRESGQQKSLTQNESSNYSSSDSEGSSSEESEGSSSSGESGDNSTNEDNKSSIVTDSAGEDSQRQKKQSAAMATEMSAEKGTSEEAADRQRMDREGGQAGEAGDGGGKMVEAEDKQSETADRDRRDKDDSETADRDKRDSETAQTVAVAEAVDKDAAGEESTQQKSEPLQGSRSQSSSSYTSGSSDDSSESQSEGSPGDKAAETKTSDVSECSPGDKAAETKTSDISECSPGDQAAETKSSDVFDAQREKPDVEADEKIQNVEAVENKMAADGTDQADDKTTDGDEGKSDEKIQNVEAVENKMAADGTDQAGDKTTDGDEGKLDHGQVEERNVESLGEEEDKVKSLTEEEEKQKSSVKVEEKEQIKAAGLIRGDSSEDSSLDSSSDSDSDGTVSEGEFHLTHYYHGDQETKETHDKTETSEDKDWTCWSCNHDNIATQTECTWCKSPKIRPGDTDVDKQAEGQDQEKTKVLEEDQRETTVFNDDVDGEPSEKQKPEQSEAEVLEKSTDEPEPPQEGETTAPSNEDEEKAGDKQPDGAEEAEEPSEPTRHPSISEASDAGNMHGGNDPENVASIEIPAPELLLPPPPPRLQYTGSLMPLLEEQDSEFDLSNMELTKSQWTEVSMYLETKDNLSSVTLRNMGMEDRDFDLVYASLLKSPSNPSILNLNMNNLGPLSAENIAEMLKDKPCIEVLLLQGNPVGDEGVRSLVDGLLDIQFGEQQWRKRQADAVEETDLSPRRQKGKFCHLKELDLGDTDMTDEGTTDIALLLEHNTDVNTLSLQGNRYITRWSKIGKSLSKNHKLKTLTLDHNKIGDDGIEAVAAGLKNNTSIRVLDLANTWISAKGGAILIDLLKKNTTLLEVTLNPGNSIPDSVLDDIKKYLHLNQSFTV